MTDEIRPTFQGEVMLAGWKESHTSGATVTLWLPDSSDLDVFRGLTVRKGNTAGQRFMAVLVEISDDEQPAAPRPTGPLCLLAVRWCENADFQQWLIRQHPDAWANVVDDIALGAADAVRFLCGIDSRKELDTDMDAAKLFHVMIREPYSKYLADHPPPP